MGWLSEQDDDKLVAEIKKELERNYRDIPKDDKNKIIDSVMGRVCRTPVPDAFALRSPSSERPYRRSREIWSAIAAEAPTLTTTVASEV